jgi:mutator protein MutT
MKEVSRIGAYGITVFNGWILLVQQKKGPLKGLFDLPGGGIDPGETPEETLIREFLEEVCGHFQKSTLLERLYHTHNYPDLTYHLTAHIFFVEGYSQKIKTETAELSYDWYPLRKLSTLSLTPVAEKSISLLRL